MAQGSLGERHGVTIVGLEAWRKDRWVRTMTRGSLGVRHGARTAGRDA